MYALDAKTVIPLFVVLATIVRPLCADTSPPSPTSDALREKDRRLLTAYKQVFDYYNAEEWEQAAETLRYVVENADEGRLQTHAQYYLAEALVELKQFDEAARVYGEIRCEPYAPQFAKRICFRRGEALYQLGRWEDARRQLEQFAEVYPDSDDNAYVMPYLGEIAFEQGRVADARHWYERALECAAIGPFVMRCQLRVGDAARRLNDLKSARAAYGVVVSSDVGDLKYEAMFRLGELEYNAGNRQRATDYFQPIVAERPTAAICENARDAWGRCRYELSCEYLQQGDHESARSEFQQLTREPLLAETVWAARAYERIGESYFQQQHYEQALRAFLTVDAVYRDLPLLQAVCLRRAAECYQREGHSANARTMLARAAVKQQSVTEPTASTHVGIANAATRVALPPHTTDKLAHGH